MHYNKVIKIAVSAIVLASIAGNSHATAAAMPDTKPHARSALLQALSSNEYYIGFDAKKRRMHYEKNLGSNIMPKIIPEYGVFAGVKFNEYFGLEFGYEWSKKVTAKAAGKEGDTILNIQTREDEEHHHTLLYKRTGYKLHVIFYTPTLIANKAININAFIAAGYSWQRIFFHNNLLIKSYVPEPDENLRQQNLVTSKRTFIIPELKTGLDFTVNTRIHIRPYLGWSRTAKLPRFEDDYPNKDIYSLKHKNSFTYGIELCVSS